MIVTARERTIHNSTIKWTSERIVKDKSIPLISKINLIEKVPDQEFCEENLTRWGERDQNVGILNWIVTVFAYA